MPQRPPRYRATRSCPSPAEAARPSAHERGYTAAWQQARLSFLADHPLCGECSAKGVDTEATVVDHVVAHKGDHELFWGAGNWRALCASCHSKKTVREDGGFGRPPAAGK